MSAEPIATTATAATQPQLQESQVTVEEFSCKQCRMKFDSKVKYANHVQSFCADSVYGEPQKLLKQLKLEHAEERTAAHHLSFTEIRQFLHSDRNHENGQIGKLTLGQLRTKMNSQATDTDLEAYKTQMLKRREQELVSQLKELQRHEKQLSLQRQHKEAVLSETLQRCHHDHEHAIQLRLETARVTDMVSGAERSDLEALNREKQHEIAQLQQQRCEIEALEQKAQQEMAALTADMEQEKEVFAQRKNKLFAIRGHSGARGGGAGDDRFGLMQLKIMANAEKHGQVTAHLDIEREHLQQTRESLLSKLNDGDGDGGHDRAQELNGAAAAGQAYEQQTSAIASLKAQFEAENEGIARHMDAHQQLRQQLKHCPQQVEAAHVSAVLQANRQHIPSPTQTTPQAEAETAPVTPVQIVTEDSRAPATTHAHEALAAKRDPGTAAADTKLYMSTPPTPPSHIYAHPQQQQQQTQQFSSEQSQPFAAYPNYAPHASAYPPYAAYGAHHPHETLMQQQQLSEQFKMTQKLLATHDTEHEMLQQEMRQMHDKREREQHKLAETEFRQTLAMLRAKVTQSGTGTGTCLMPRSLDDAASDTALDMHEHSNNDLRHFEKQERKLLTLIAKFGDDVHVKNAYADQLRSIISLKVELQQLQQQKQIQTLKHEVAVQESALQSQSEHEQWMQEQERLLQRTAMEKKLAALGLLLHAQRRSKPVVETAENRLVSYESERGFGLHFDFVSGLQSSHTQCRLVTCVVDGTKTSLVESTLQTASWQNVYESRVDGDALVAMFDNVSVSKMRPMSAEHKLLVDVQCRDDQGNETHYAWTIIAPICTIAAAQVVNDGGGGGHGDADASSQRECIANGHWKTPLYAPPILLHATTENAAAAQLSATPAVLYFRILTDANECAQQHADTHHVELWQLYDTYDPLSLIADREKHVVRDAGDVGVERDKIVDGRQSHSHPSRIHTATSHVSETAKRKNSRSGSGSRSRSQSHSQSFLEKESVDSGRQCSEKSESELLYHQENGFGLLLTNLEHQSKFAFAKIRATLYQQQQELGSDWWESDFAQEGLYQLGVYEWQQRHVFENVAYTPHSVLVLELFESAQLRDARSRPATAQSRSSALSQSQQEISATPVLWAAVPVFKLDELRRKPAIHAATHRLPLFRYPVDFASAGVLGGDSSEDRFDSGGAAAAAESVLCIQLFDPGTPPLVKNIMLTQQQQPQPQQEYGLESIQEIQERRPWMRVSQTRNTSIVFEDGDGIDLYVDGARFLPESTTVSKLYVQLLWLDDDGKAQTFDKREVRNAVSAKAESCLEPVYNFRAEFRKDAFEKNAVFVFRVDSAQKYGGECLVVGYAAIPAFNHNDDARQRKCLNVGAFQLPLFFEVKATSLLHNLVKLKIDGHALPCSTLLVRIVAAPRSADGTTVLSDVVQPMPSYHDHVYDTFYCEPSIHELRLYNALHESRIDKSVIDAVRETFADGSAELDDAAFAQFCDAKLRPSVNKQVRFIDLTYFARYNQGMGVALAIDGINNIFHRKPKASMDSLYVVVYTVCPPSTFFEENFKISDNVFCQCDWDTSSMTKSPRFHCDKLQVFKDSDFEFHPNAILFCEVREVRYQLADDAHNSKNLIRNLKIVPFGFSFFPLFSVMDDRDNKDDGTVYVRNGSFQNMVFTYPSQLENDATTNDAYVKRVIGRILGDGAESVLHAECDFKSKSQQLLRPVCDGTVGKTSICVRIYDNQRRSTKINARIDDGLSVPADLNDHLIPSSKRCEYEYDASKRGSWNRMWGRKPITIQTLFDSNHKNAIDVRTFKNKISKQIAQALDVTAVSNI